MGSSSFFTPKAASTVVITCAITSANVPFSPGQTGLDCRIRNLDPTNTAYVELGITASVVAVVPTSATLGSMPIGPNETIALSVPAVSLWFAAICTAGTPALAFTPGNGDSR